jgi:hypothetical protein
MGQFTVLSGRERYGLVVRDQAWQHGSSQNCTFQSRVSDLQGKRRVRDKTAGHSGLR